tara:strand:+ start:1443 stop:1889 length:447 start_codon:yes stop_codon:yes gene_type:complete
MSKEASLKFHMNLGMLIRSAHNSMTERFVQNVLDSGLDISMDQWMILGPIWQLQSPSQKELGEICLKDKPSISRIVDSLEKKSLVVRVADQIDHRIKHVVLTKAGKQLFYDVLPIMEKTREEVRGEIPEEEIEVFKKVLSKIIRNLTK